MKRLLLISITSLALTCSAASYDLEYNGLYYKFNSAYTEATLVKGTKAYSGNIIVPSEVPYLHITIPVKAIDSQAFDGATELDTITFSEGVPCYAKNCSVKKIFLKGDNTVASVLQCNSLNEIEIQGAIVAKSSSSSLEANVIRIGANVPVCLDVRLKAKVEYVVNNSNPWYRCDNGLLLCSDEQSHTTLLGVEGCRNGDIVVPDDIDEITDSCFYLLSPFCVKLFNTAQ